MGTEMIEVREATKSDTPDVLRMAERAYRAGGNHDFMGNYDPSRMETIVAHLLKDDDGIILVANDGNEAVGMVALAMSNVVLSATYSMAQEITWWVEPGHRKAGVGERLLEVAMAWARERGAPHLWMSVPKTSQSIARMCVRRGFKLLESIYIKEV